jgi:hypothetical protein
VDIKRKEGWVVGRGYVNAGSFFCKKQSAAGCVFFYDATKTRGPSLLIGVCGGC